MKFRVTIRTLTPLHIGCGRELLKTYDYVVNPAERKIYVLDQDAIYMEEFEGKGAEARLMLPAGQLKTLDQFKPGSRYVFYDLDGTTHLEQIRAVTKNHRMEPYIPGSSLKGAIRTALMARAIEQRRFTPQMETLDRSKERAAAEWERAVFGENPNLSWMRAMQVTDTQPLPLTDRPLECLGVSVYTGSQAEAPIAVEAIRRGSKLECEVSIDELSLRYRDELDWEGKDILLADFIDAIRAFSDRRIQVELAAAQKNRWTKRGEFFQSLQKVAEDIRERNGAVLQLGWGSGWTGTTIGLLLGKNLSDQVRTRYQLGRPQKASRDWRPDLSKAFPASRRLSVDNERPLGWVALFFQPCGQASELWNELTAQAVASRPARAAVVENIQSSVTPEQSVPASVADSPPAEKLFLTFTDLPKPGDRFIATVIEVRKNGLAYLEIPGLDGNDVMGVVHPEDQASAKALKVDTKVNCQVIALGPDSADKNMTLVRCRAG